MIRNRRVASFRKLPCSCCASTNEHAFAGVNARQLFSVEWFRKSYCVLSFVVFAARRKLAANVLAASENADRARLWDGGISFW